jgi:hypothetical protein
LSRRRLNSRANANQGNEQVETNGFHIQIRDVASSVDFVRAFFD